MSPITLVDTGGTVVCIRGNMSPAPTDAPKQRTRRSVRTLSTTLHIRVLFLAGMLYVVLLIPLSVT